MPRLLRYIESKRQICRRKILGIQARHRHGVLAIALLVVFLSLGMIVIPGVNLVALPFAAGGTALIGPGAFLALSIILLPVGLVFF